MTAISFVASSRHFVDHLAPLWKALPSTERGTFAAIGMDALTRARQLGLRPSPRPGVGDVTVIASHSDVARAATRRLVFLEHGAGQSYGGEPPDGAEPSEEHCRIELFLVPSERVARRNRLHHPHARSVAIGCPKLDAFAGGVDRQHGARPTVAFTFHWRSPLCTETMWAWPEYRHEIDALVRAEPPWRLLGHGHPRAWSELRREWRRLGIDHTPDPVRVLGNADVLVVDNSSLGFEFLALGKPVVWLNGRQWRRNVDHGMRFWEYADSGVQVNLPGDLAAAIERSLADDPCAARREQVAGEVYAQLDGMATARALDEIRSVLVS